MYFFTLFINSVNMVYMKCIELTNSIYKVSHYLSMEEYFLETKKECFFIWNIEPSIVIGKNQIAQIEVNMPYAKEKSITIYRRPSGGGAIYADEGCFMYSFVVKKDNVENLYKNNLSKICNALNKLNIAASLSGRNDILFNNQKISGVAIQIKNDYAVVHGTMLYKSNFDEMTKLLTPSRIKLESNGIKSIKSRVINLSDYLPFNSKYEFMKYLENEISENNKDNIISLSKNEIDIINRKEQIYLNSDYLNTKIPYSYKQSKKFKSGLITVYFKIINNIIKDVTISGDFFEINDVKEIGELFINKQFNKDNIFNIIDNIDISKYIDDINNEEFKELFDNEFS